MTTPAVRRVTVRRGVQFEAYDMTTGEPCPARYEVEDVRSHRVYLLVEAGVGVRIHNKDCVSVYSVPQRGVTGARHSQG